jgi:hypothetical protein
VALNPLVRIVDLTGAFWARLIQSNAWTNEAKDAEKVVQLGTDYREAVTDRGAAGTREAPSRGLQGCRYLEAKLRDECLNQEIFYSLKEAQVVIENWCKHHNIRRLHSALEYRPLAPATVMPSINPLELQSQMH